MPKCGLLNTPAGNHTFDNAFLILQAAGMAFFVLAIWKPRWFRQAAVRGTALVLVVGLPLLWTVAFPERNGIEGAARLILAAPLVAMNILLAFVADLRGRGR